MACLIVAESAIFTIFVVAYLFYVGKSLSGPTPREVLETPIFYTICLLSSSLTIHFAARFLERGKSGAFLVYWLLTIVLGGLFHVRHRPGMAPADLRARTDDLDESLWHDVLLAGRSARVPRDRRSRHAVRSCSSFGLAGRVSRNHSSRVDVLSLYWHFVDAVWVVVFTVVYVIGR